VTKAEKESGKKSKEYAKALKAEKKAYADLTKTTKTHSKTLREYEVNMSAVKDAVHKMGEELNLGDGALSNFDAALNVVAKGGALTDAELGAVTQELNNLMVGATNAGMGVDAIAEDMMQMLL
jgi:hypothetical protein